MDPAVDAVLTAETIHSQLCALTPQLRSLSAIEVSDAVGQAQSLYPELWSALDRARSLLRERGIDLPVYDETRAQQPVSMLGVDLSKRTRNDAAMIASTAAFLLGGVGGVVVGLAIDINEVKNNLSSVANRGGLADAKVALETLRAAMPEIEWAALRRHESREAALAIGELSAAKGKKLVVGLVGLAVVCLVCFGLVKLLQGSRAPTKQEIAAKEQADYEAAKDEIRELNDVLRDRPCDIAAAEKRVRLFVAQDQSSTARKLAKKFLEECGDDAYMRSVAGGAS